MEADFSNLQRAIQPMSGFIRQALEQHGVLADFMARPAYQQNDYVAWIERAKRPATKDKRLQQMLRELETGGVYMNMVHRPSTKK